MGTVARTSFLSTYFRFLPPPSLLDLLAPEILISDLILAQELSNRRYVICYAPGIKSVPGCLLSLFPF